MTSMASAAESTKSEEIEVLLGDRAGFRQRVEIDDPAPELLPEPSTMGICSIRPVWMSVIASKSFRRTFRSRREKTAMALARIRKCILRMPKVVKI